MSTILWQAKLDDMYDVVVEQNSSDPYIGTITLSLGGVLLAEKSVAILYGGTFGPDIENVQEWQEWASQVVDAPA